MAQNFRSKYEVEEAWFILMSLWVRTNNYMYVYIYIHLYIFRIFSLTLLREEGWGSHYSPRGMRWYVLNKGTTASNYDQQIVTEMKMYHKTGTPVAKLMVCRK